MLIGTGLTLAVNAWRGERPAPFGLPAIALIWITGRGFTTIYIGFNPE
jgi:hypothetical protein